MRYRDKVQRALRGVVREILEEVDQDGLRGSQHLFVTFRTDHPSTELDPSLTGRYPEEMTVVLQHQFRILAIDDDVVQLELYFNGRPSVLTIPWAAITQIVDPSAPFGLDLRFEEADSETGRPREAGGSTGSDRLVAPVDAEGDVATTRTPRADSEPGETEGAEKEGKEARETARPDADRSEHDQEDGDRGNRGGGGDRGDTGNKILEFPGSKTRDDPAPEDGR